jgi:uncharacterized protein
MAFYLEAVMRGILLLAGLIAVSANVFAASPYISCPAARSVDERAICRSTMLVQMDAEMATLYRAVTGLVGMGRRGALRDDQADWLKERRVCGASVRCLRGHYQERIDELDAVLDQIRAGGPY